MVTCGAAGGAAAEGVARALGVGVERHGAADGSLDGEQLRLCVDAPVGSRVVSAGGALGPRLLLCGSVAMLSADADQLGKELEVLCDTVRGLKESSWGEISPGVRQGLAKKGLRGALRNERERTV